MSNNDPSTQTSVNIPSLVAFAVISFFAIRYLFFSSSSASPNVSASLATYPGTAGRRAVPPEKIETVASMFPQLARRDIEWDLLRNGGSVQATTEKVLRDGRLSTPPPSFQAQPDPAASSSSASALDRHGARAQQQQKQQYSDLITRYNLSHRLAQVSTQSNKPDAVEGNPHSAIQTTEVQKEKGGWSSNKTERQALLKRRREEMVLAARRKLEEKQRMKGSG